MRAAVLSLGACLLALGLWCAASAGVLAEEVTEGTTGETEATPEEPEETPGEPEKIPFDETTITVQFEKTKSKLNDDPDDGQYYYKGENLHPTINVYYDEEIDDTDGIPSSEIVKKNGKKYHRILLEKGVDYKKKFEDPCKDPGEYTVTITAKGDRFASGSVVKKYKILNKHVWGSWTKTVQPTVFKEGTKKRTCSICGESKTKAVAKVTPTVTLNMKTIELQKKQSTSAFEVSGLARGDYVKSYQSGSKNIFTVSSKGVIKAGAKTGKAKLTVTLGSGKKATATVKVKKGIVKTTSIDLRATSLMLLKGGTYTLQATQKPLTSQEKITYSSSNKKVATVTSGGVIKAKKKGTATITVTSGSKKKTCKISVEKGSNSAFLKICSRIATEIMADGDWTYYSGTGMARNYEEARAREKRQTSCASYVNFCMQEFGTLGKEMAFYSDTSGKLVCKTATTADGRKLSAADVRESIEKYYDFINVGGKIATKTDLQPGDICLWNGHTNIFAGYNSSGVPTWYDAGRGSTKAGKPGSVFTNMYRATTMGTSLKIYMIMRLKK